MNRLLLISGIVLFAVLCALFFWYLRNSKRNADEALAKFNEINKELSSAHDSMTAQQRIKTAQISLPVGIMNSKIILLIDSLSNQFKNSNVPDDKPLPKLPEQDLRRLLQYMQEVNKLKWDMVDSRIPDTINYWPSKFPFDKNKWLTEFFRNQPRVAVTTYLAYLKNQAIANND